jgi:hypothetical protein
MLPLDLGAILCIGRQFIGALVMNLSTTTGVDKIILPERTSRAELPRDFRMDQFGLINQLTWTRLKSMQLY